MNVKLVVEQGARRRVMHVRPPEAVLGRGRGNAVRIPSAEVSRQHCRLTIEDGLVRVEDLGSVNGTFLNGRKVRGAEYVRPGDSLEVGPVTFVVEYELTPEALERLREEEAPADMLDLLASGEVVLDADDLEALGGDDEDLVVVEPEEEEEAAELAEPAGEDELVASDFSLDGSAAWQMPKGNEFRDMLSQLGDEGDAPTRERKPKRR